MRYRQHRDWSDWMFENPIKTILIALLLIWLIGPQRWNMSGPIDKCYSPSGPVCSPYDD